MGNGGHSEILEAEQYFVRRLAHFPDCIQASGRQRVANPRRKFNLADRRGVRKFWSRIEHRPPCSAQVRESTAPPSGRGIEAGAVPGHLYSKQPCLNKAGILKVVPAMAR
jgi:hypothetical protein